MKLPPAPREIELLGLTVTNFDTPSADVYVIGDAAVEYPRLLLDSPEESLSHIFADGRLRVREAEATAAGPLEVGDSAEIPARHAATLVMPPAYAVEHHIATQTGDVEVTGISAELLSAATLSGRITVRASVIETAKLSSMTGKVEIDCSHATKNVWVQTASGNVVATDSTATYWQLCTQSGDLAVTSTQGGVSTATDSGRVFFAD